MLHVVLLDCAIEIIPPEIRSLKQIQQYASRRKKPVDELLLDQSHHGRATLRLEDHERRGRPDITSLSLHTLLETPLRKSGGLTVHLHLQDGRIIEVSPEVRLPRNYERFMGLMEQLLTYGRVPPEGTPLLRAVEIDLPGLIKRLENDSSDSLRVLAHESGTPTSLQGLVQMLPEDPSVPVIIGVGAFPHGDLRDDIMAQFDQRISLDSEVMMSWHVCAEILWAYSLRTSVVQRRLEMEG